MKQIFLLLLGLGMTGILQAQITITVDDFVDVGDSVQLAVVDSVPAGFNAGPSGPDRHWDFSNLMMDTQAY